MSRYSQPFVNFAFCFLLLGLGLWLGYDSEAGFSYSSRLSAVVLGSFALRELFRGIKGINKEEAFKARMRKRLEEKRKLR
ncbi:MAG: hypothetical protein AAGF53_11000 [Pseudomonadota bacterium]